MHLRKPDEHFPNPSPSDRLQQLVLCPFPQRDGLGFLSRLPLGDSMSHFLGFVPLSSQPQPHQHCTDALCLFLLQLLPAVCSLALLHSSPFCCQCSAPFIPRCSLSSPVTQGCCDVSVILSPAPKTTGRSENLLKCEFGYFGSSSRVIQNSVLMILGLGGWLKLEGGCLHQLIRKSQQYSEKYIKMKMAICQFFPLINKILVYQMFSFGYVTKKIKQLVIQA